MRRNAGQMIKASLCVISNGNYVIVAEVEAERHNGSDERSSTDEV